MVAKLLRVKGVTNLTVKMSASPLNASAMPLPGAHALFCALLAALWVLGACAAFAQNQTTGQPLETLEQEFTDPLTTLPQVFLKDAYSPANYGTNVQTNQLIARAISPRIPPYLLQILNVRCVLDAVQVFM